MKNLSFKIIIATILFFLCITMIYINSYALLGPELKIIGLQTVEVGKEIQLKAEIGGYNDLIPSPSISPTPSINNNITGVWSGEDISNEVTWISSNPSVATVDENGIVTGLSEGKVTITATRNDVSISETNTSSIDISVETLEEMFISNNLNLVGDTEISSTSEQSLTLKLSSEDYIGTIQGTISYDSNIEYVKVSSNMENESDTNNWKTLYDIRTGNFVTYNINGGTFENVFEFKYKLKEGKTQGTIAISNIEFTDMDYRVSNIQSEVVTISLITEPIVIESDDYNVITVDNIDYVSEIIENTSFNEFKEKANIDNMSVSLADKDGNPVEDDNAIIKTGMTLTISSENTVPTTYTLVVTGDVTGDGNVTGSDLLKVARYNAGLDDNLNGAYKQAANVIKTGDSETNILINMSDLLKIARVLVGLDIF